MIKVIFVDTKDGEHKVVQESRELLKDQPILREMFARDINHQICHFIGKLREEKKEADKWNRQSKP